MSYPSIPDTIARYFGDLPTSVPARYRAWEHCFAHFSKADELGAVIDKEKATLHLATYLANWGMYRGSSFLPDFDFTIHIPVVERLWDPSVSALRNKEMGGSLEDLELVEALLSTADAIRSGYRPYGKATHTLVTKVMLGAIGCFPTLDTLFVAGARQCGLQCADLSRKTIECIVRFCLIRLDDLRQEQEKIKKRSPIRYPLMKIVDMYFWQIGFELDQKSQR